MAQILNFGKRQDEIEKEKAVIYNALVKFYKDLNDSGKRNAYYISAKDKYNECIKSLADVHYFYKKIMTAQNIS